MSLGGAKLLQVAPLITLGGFLAGVAILAIPGALLLTILFAKLIFAVLLGALVLSAILLARRSWPAALALIPAVGAVYLLAMVPRPSVSVVARTATWVQFLFVRHTLVQRATQLHVVQQGGPVVLAVDGFVPTGSNGFVYDASGEVRLAPAARSDAWQAAAEPTELGSQCAWAVRPLFGPYYAYSSSC
jgi:hypothetical protein